MDRVKIIGDHPHRGAVGTLVAVKSVCGAPMAEIEFDQPHLGIEGCFADKENLRLLPRDEDPLS